MAEHPPTMAPPVRVTSVTDTRVRASVIAAAPDGERTFVRGDGPIAGRSPARARRQAGAVRRPAPIA